jgi:hypothetical protein
MRKQLTGEPVAGKPHTGFGGRGRREPFPTPIHREKSGYAWVRFMRNAAAGDVDSQLDLQGPRQTGPNAKSIF